MRAGRVRDIYEMQPFLKVAIVGASGSGKSHWAARSPRPLIIATEPQSVVTTFTANPDAFVVTIEGWEDFRRVWNAVKIAKSVTIEVEGPDGQIESQPACEADILGETIVFQTVVVDSFTDLQRMAIAKLAGIEDGHKDRLDFGGAAANLTLEKWGMLVSGCEAIWSQQRALRCNTVFLFVAEDRLDDQQVKTTVPMLSGKQLPYAMGQYFNAVGLQYIRALPSGAVHYTTRFVVPSSRGIAKPAPGWPNVITHSTTPGHTTLGSLLRYSYPNLVVAAEPHDSASFIEPPSADDSADALGVSDMPAEQVDDQARRQRRRRV